VITGVVTNGPVDARREKIAHLSLEARIDFAVISGEFGAGKPVPAIFVEAMRRAGADPVETVFAGDSVEHDIAGAHAAGIHAIWLNRTGRPWTVPDVPRPHEVASLSALLPLLAVKFPRGPARTGDEDYT